MDHTQGRAPGFNTGKGERLRKVLACRVARSLAAASLGACMLLNFYPFS